MNIKKTIFLIITLIVSVNSIIAQTAYDDDAAEVDYYVPGILANDGMSMVNFLLCFVASTNFSSFIDKGAYIALTEENKCENAGGADATADKAAATGSSASGGGAAATGNNAEEVNYTKGIYQHVTSGNTVLGKGWTDIEIDVGMNDEKLTTVAYQKQIVSADKSATNRFGSFSMRYDLRNTQTSPSNGITQLNMPIQKGFMNVDGTTIQSRETGMEGPDRIVTVDLADPNNIQGFIQSKVVLFDGSALATYAVTHKFQVNEGADRYCQKFDSATPYTRNSSGQWEAGTAVAESDFVSLISAAVYVETDGGTSGTITGEHCWNTSRSEAKRVIYEYGTYKTDGSRADLTTPAMSLQANMVDNASLSKPIWSHASYWGSHINPVDRANVTDSTIFKNQRDANDNNQYNLRKNYYEINRLTRQRLSLNQLGGVSLQWYANNFKDGGTFQTKLANLGSGIPVTGACNATDGNCPEYSGNITVNEAGTEVTFTLINGMDWGNGIMPFELATPITFTAANWAADMTDSGHNRRMHFWDPDSHQSYTIPFAAFGDVDSTTLASQARTRINEKISIEQLEADITAAGDNSTGLMCIRECLDAANINSAIDAAFTAVAAETSPGVLNFSPFKDVGGWWKETVYYDGSSPANNNQDVGENDVAAGSYNNIGGIKVADAAIYTVVTDSGEKKLRDGSAGTTYLEYNSTNKPKVDAREHGDDLSNYQFYYKPAAYSENYSGNFGWSFHMRTVIDTDTNKSALLCETDSGNARGYNSRWRAKDDDAAIHNSGTTAYYCDYRLWEGAVDTEYSINFKQMPDYRLYNDTTSQFVNVSAPEQVMFTVPASGVKYNFSGTNLAGKRYKLKFEGFGELHNLPGKVVNTCTGVVIGRYNTGAWNQCYRYIHEFIIPDGTVLTNSGGDDIKVRAMRGDEYLTKLGSVPAGVAYSKTAADLPAANNLQDLYEGENSIGAAPTVALPSSGSDEPSVIHGETIHSPPAN
jgi:hypothetical protein